MQEMGHSDGHLAMQEMGHSDRHLAMQKRGHPGGQLVLREQGHSRRKQANEMKGQCHLEKGLPGEVTFHERRAHTCQKGFPLSMGFLP